MTKNANDLSLTCYDQGDSTWTTTEPAADNFLITNSANRLGKNLPMRLLGPIDAGYAYEYHKWAHPQVTYRAKVLVQGGEMPFKASFVTAPAGATMVGEFTQSTDVATGATLHEYPEYYMWVEWTSPTGTEDFEVLITDQAGETVTASWTTVTDANAFVVLDSVGGNDANPGTYDLPLQTFVAGLWKSSQFDSTYADKIVLYKDGVYPIYQDSPDTNVGIDAGVKPRSHIAINRRQVEFGTDTGHFFINCGSTAFIGMYCNGSRATAANTRIFQVSTKNNSHVFADILFDNHASPGTSGNDNPACIVVMDSTTYSENVSVVDCELGTNAKFQLICTFRCDGVLIENNKGIGINIPSSNGNEFIHIKDDTIDISSRFNKATGSIGGSGVRFSNQQGNLGGSANQESVCDMIISDTEDYEAGPFNFNQNSTSFNNPDNVFLTRPTIVSATYAINARTWVGGPPVEVRGAAYVAPLGLQVGGGITTGVPANESLASADLDANGELTNTNNKRDELLGYVGHTIAVRAA